ncbi:MAG: hypothetical protein CBD79_01100 [Gammaproteobacteria bacterium TMED219]|nr:MAG: hypothetical protein CBD79_01100 [Gammaproteobacteria bacterium TMED219]
MLLRIVTFMWKAFDNTDFKLFWKQKLKKSTQFIQCLSTGKTLHIVLSKKNNTTYCAKKLECKF